MDIKENIKLASYTYYKIGGNARYFCEVKDKNDVIGALKFADKKRLPVFVLGGGTNVLISDDGFKGLVLKMRNKKLKIKEINKKQKNNNILIKVGAELLLANLVNFALKNGFQGLEWAAGIPGTVGGAIRGNAGAFGSCMAEIVELATVLLGHSEHSSGEHSVLRSEAGKHRVLGRTGEESSSQSMNHESQIVNYERRSTKYEVRRLTNKDMQFGYRSSVIKEKGGIILEATIRLKKIKNKEEKIKSKELINDYLKYRKKHQPLNYPSCGSIFKNVFVGALNLEKAGLNAKQRQNLKGFLLEAKKAQSIRGDKVAAGRLIAAAGLAGKKVGQAQISERHANFIVNLGGAKAQDVYQLIKLCQKEIYRKFGVRLEPEVEFLGFDNMEHITWSSFMTN